MRGVGCIHINDAQPCDPDWLAVEGALHPVQHSYRAKTNVAHFTFFGDGAKKATSSQPPDITRDGALNWPCGLSKVNLVMKGTTPCIQDQKGKGSYLK